MSHGTIDYDEHWAMSLDTYQNHPTSRHRRRFVLRALERIPGIRDAFVFDYGCGAGLILAEAASRFGLKDGHVGGCDVSKTALALVREQFPEGCFFLGKFPELDRAIDVVVCTEVLEHTTEYEAVIAWFHAHLRDAGWLILTTPGTPMDPPDEYYGHTQHFTRRQLRQLLNDTGFDVIQLRRWGWPLFTLQKWITKRYFNAIKAGYMEGALSPKKRAIFTLAYWIYFIHDLAPWGPQIFLVARKR